MSSTNDNPSEEAQEIARDLAEARDDYAKICADIMDAAREFSEREARKEAHKLWLKDLRQAVEAGRKRRTYNPRGGR